MEDLKAQKKIIDLGKAIVKELELDPGVDTLANSLGISRATCYRYIQLLQAESKSKDVQC